MLKNLFPHLKAPTVAFSRKSRRFVFGEQPVGSVRKSAVDTERWITIGAKEDEGHGVHVKISGDGKIVAGPAGLADKGIRSLSDFGKGKEESSHTDNLNEARKIVRGGKLAKLHRSLLQSAIEHAENGDHTAIADRLHKSKKIIADQDAKYAVEMAHYAKDTERLSSQFGHDPEKIKKEIGKAQKEYDRMGQESSLENGAGDHSPRGSQKQRIMNLKEALEHAESRQSPDPNIMDHLREETKKVFNDHGIGNPDSQWKPETPDSTAHGRSIAARQATHRSGAGRFDQSHDTLDDRDSAHQHSLQAEEHASNGDHAKAAKEHEAAAKLHDKVSKWNKKNKDSESADVHATAAESHRGAAKLHQESVKPVSPPTVNKVEGKQEEPGQTRLSQATDAEVHAELSKHQNQLRDLMQQHRDASQDASRPAASGRDIATKQNAESHRDSLQEKINGKQKVVQKLYQEHQSRLSKSQVDASPVTPSPASSAKQPHEGPKGDFDRAKAEKQMDRNGYAEHGEHKVKVVPHPASDKTGADTEYAVETHHNQPGQMGSVRDHLPEKHPDIESAQRAAVDHLEGLQRAKDPKRSFADRFNEHMAKRGHELDARNHALAEHLNANGANVTASDINRRFSNHHVDALGGQATDEHVRDALAKSVPDKFHDPYMSGPITGPTGGDPRKQQERAESLNKQHLENADEHEKDAKVMRAAGNHELANKLDSRAGRLRSSVESNRKQFDQAIKDHDASVKQEAGQKAAARQFKPEPNKATAFTPKQMATDFSGGRYDLSPTLRDKGWYTDSRVLIKPPEKLAKQILDNVKPPAPGSGEARQPEIAHILEAAKQNRGPQMHIIGERSQEHNDGTDKKPKMITTHDTLLSTPDGQHSLVNSKYVRTIQKMYPNATFHVPTEKTGPVVVKHGGEVVGVLMPYSSEGKKGNDDHNEIVEHVKRVTGATKPVRKSMTSLFPKPQRFAHPSFKSLQAPSVRFDKKRGRMVIEHVDAIPQYRSVTKGWITLKPHGDDEEGYVHVLVDGNGRILAGPKTMEGKNVSHLSGTHKQVGEESRTHPAPKNPKEPVDNPPNTASIMSGSGSESGKGNEGGKAEGGKVETNKPAKRIAHLTGDTFMVKEQLKDGGWKWNPGKKVFEKEVDADASDADVVRGIRMLGGVRNRPKVLNVTFPEQATATESPKQSGDAGGENPASEPSGTRKFTKTSNMRNGGFTVGNYTKSPEGTYHIVTETHPPKLNDYGKYEHSATTRPATDEEVRNIEEKRKQKEAEQQANFARYQDR